MRREMKSRFETHGDLSWCELLTTDIEGAKRFYKEVLGWGMEQMPMEGEPYTVIRAGDHRVGGIMRMPEQVPAGTPPHWETYITVNDVDAVARKAKEQGGRILVLPTDIPNVGRFCTFQDPQGEVLSAIMYKEMAKD